MTSPHWWGNSWPLPDDIHVGPYLARPRSGSLQGLLGAGVPKDYAAFLVLILGFFKAGYAERTTGAVLQITGQPPRTIEQYAKDYRGSWA